MDEYKMDEFKRQVEFTEKMPAAMGLFMTVTPNTIAEKKEEALNENWFDLNNLTHSNGRKRDPTLCEETLAAYKTAATWMKADLTLMEHQAQAQAQAPIVVEDKPEQVWRAGGHDGGRKSKRKTKRKSKKKRSSKKR